MFHTKNTKEEKITKKRRRKGFRFMPNKVLGRTGRRYVWRKNIFRDSPTERPRSGLVVGFPLSFSDAQTACLYDE
jgi:hypothetical protein